MTARDENGARRTAYRWRSLGNRYDAPPAAPSHRSFGLTVGGVLLAIGAFSAWRGHTIRAEIAGAIGAALVVAALVRPSSLAWLARWWGRLGQALGWFNSRVLLTLMFLFVLWPIGVVSRLFGSDPLDTRRRSGSFWVGYSDRLRDPKHYERPF